VKQTIFRRLAFLIAAGCVLAGITVQAQQGQGGFGGAGQRSGTASRNSPYPNKTDIGQARITYDAETRSLIVVSDDETAEHIKDMVKKLDRPTPQVLINCVFMEATYTKDTDFGVNGTYTHTISGSSVGAINTPPGQNNTASTAFNLARTFGSTAGSGGLYNLVGQDLNVTLSALAQAGKTEILSRPSILARNNQQATITIGQQVPLISGVTYDSFGNQRNAISYQNVGIILQVTPFITSDGMVEMIVAPQVSSVSSSTVTFAAGGTNNASSPSAPIIDIRSADTVVVVPDGQTVAIGGLMQNQKVSSEQKVPLLGDIPLLGMLFKHKTTDNAKKELLIFLTPHIVNRPTELAAHTDSERAKTDMSRKGFSEGELNRYLDKAPPAQAPAPVPTTVPATKPTKSPKASE
jgi:general secretion pathway protein D